MDSVLLQLVGPQLDGAADELRAALAGNWPVNTAAVSATKLIEQQQQHHQPGLPQQQQQHMQGEQGSHAACSSFTAVVCFRALHSIVTSLPTGAAKYVVRLPRLGRHPRQAQHMHLAAAGGTAMAVQQQQQVAGASIKHHRTDDASMCSASICSASDLSSALTHAVLPVSGGGGVAVSHTASAAAGQQREHIACGIVARLLARAAALLHLALRVVVAAGSDHHHHQQSRLPAATQLLVSASSFALAALSPAAAHHERCRRAGDRSDAAGQGAADSPPLAVLLRCMCEIIQQLPVPVVQLPSVLQLLNGLLTAAMSLDSASLSHQRPPLSSSTAGAAEHGHAGSGWSGGDGGTQLLNALERAIGAGLNAACSAILAVGAVVGKGSGSCVAAAADPAQVSAALMLAATALQQCPSALAATDMDGLVSTVLVASSSQDTGQCSAVLEWVHALCAALAVGSCAPGPASCTSSHVMTALRGRLDAGGGPQLVLALLLAASGGMPPDAVLPVSAALHDVAVRLGRAVTEPWLELAVLTLAPDTAPWARQRHVSKVAFVHDLLDCADDANRFKRLLKGFCGGKKKGTGAVRP